MTSGKRCAPSGGWRPKNPERERFEVLHNGGEVEFVARGGKSPEPHPLEAVVNFQVREAHLDTEARSGAVAQVARPGPPFHASHLRSRAGSASRKAAAIALGGSSQSAASPSCVKACRIGPSRAGGAMKPPRKLAAILAADIACYTAC